MNDNELKQAFRAMAEGTDPRRAADAVRNRIASQAAAGGAREKKRKEFSMIPKKKNWTAVLAAAALVAVLTAAVAAAPILRNYINSLTLQEDSLRQLTEVPEGWIGVCTLDDLDAVREDLGGNYILMEDLSFEEGDFAEGGRFAGGWEPIGNYGNPFFGVFNGNGHTISGLVIRASADDVFASSDRTYAYWGLFGYAVYSEYTTVKTYVQHMPEGDLSEEGLDIDGDGILDAVDEYGSIIREGQTVTHTILDPTKELKHWGGGGIVKNLCLTNGLMQIEYAPVKANSRDDMKSVSLWAGPIAGYADHVLGCAVKDFSVEITGTGDEGVQTYLDYWEKQGFPITMTGVYRGSGLTMSVGGVTGGAYQLDSCMANTMIVVRAGAAQTASRPFVGGLGGLLSACVTSYYDGMIDSDAGDSGIGTIREDDVPRVLSEDVMTELAIRLAFIQVRTDNTNSTGDQLYGFPEDYEERCKELRRAGVTATTLNQWLDENDTRGDYGWQANKFMAFYFRRTVEEVQEAMSSNERMDSLSVVSLDMAQSLYTDDLSGVAFYVLDPDIKPREYMELSHIISRAFPDGDFEDFCRENHVKYGCYYAYDLRSDPACEFDGFDFDAIWTRGEDGRLPVLRLFR